MSLTPLLGSSSTINAQQNLVILSQANPMVRSPDPFFCHHKEKRKKAVWLRETNSNYTHSPTDLSNMDKTIG